MWKYEGRRTLDYYLRRRDCVAALADALGIQDAAVVPTVMQQILEGIAVRRQFLCRQSGYPSGRTAHQCSTCRSVWPEMCSRATSYMRYAPLR